LYAVGLLPYCNFGTWTAEEDQQLRKNWEKIVQVQYRCYIPALSQGFSSDTSLRVGLGAL